MKYRVDLHNHTKLCNHAEGEMEEFVKTGLEEKELFTCATCYAENKIEFIDQDGWKIITRDGKLFAQTTIYFE